MIYLQMALYCEAKPILQHFPLRAFPQAGRFQSWQSEEITLTISGTGQTEAATCAARTLAQNPPSPSDLFVLLGTCAAMHEGCEKGRLYRIHSLEDLGSGRTYYPDLLAGLELPEASLLTGYQELSRQRKHVWYSSAHEEADLYDMESAAAYAAASHFFGPHQIEVLRLVSDSGEDADLLTPDSISAMMEHEIPALEQIFEHLQKFSRMLENQSQQPSEKEQQVLAEMETAFRCSASMALHLRQLIRYAVCAGLPYETILERYEREGLIPVPGRKEGKDLLVQFERELTR